MKTSVILQSIKSKSGLMLALVFFLLIGAGSLMAMKAPHEKKQTSYKWFRISGSLNADDPVPSANATYIGEGVNPPAEGGCDGALYQCVSGFDTNQVTGSNELNGTQMPQVISSKKN